MTAPTVSTCEGETLPKLPLAPQRLSRKSAAVIAVARDLCNLGKEPQGLEPPKGRAAKIKLFRAVGETFVARCRRRRHQRLASLLMSEQNAARGSRAKACPTRG